ncbi:MAG TPA: PAS domain-containing sensor histidine kinase [Planctomycetes bacterium]|nr:PAS domain-containing sensor histidine kinase [Planctomycetota bacterium]
MIKITDLIRNAQSHQQSDCNLIVDADLSVQEALDWMDKEGCNSIGIDTEDCENFIVLSRQELLERLLAELDNAQENLMRIDEQLQCSVNEELELIGSSPEEPAPRSDRTLELAFANMTEGVIILDGAGAVQKANPPAKILLGLSEKDDCRTVTTVMDDLGIRELILSDRTERTCKSGQFRIRAAHQKVLQITWTQMVDGDRQLLGNVLTLHDITDRLAADRAKTEFIAAISHELRTPLTSLQNSVSNILAGVTGKVSSKTRCYLHTMKSDCRRFADLINDLLDMAKLEAGSLPINRCVMNIVTMVGDVINDFADQAKKRQVELLCEIDRHVSPVYADPKRIRQVLSNLVSNAVKFTSPGGRVCIRSYDAGDDVVTVVEDTGVGISLDLQKQIFSKFYQISRQAGPGYNGSGLGLAICDGIVAVHGGSIWVQSNEGKGSKFYFSLPKTNPFIVLRKHLGALAKRSGRKASRFGLFIINFDVPGELKERLKKTVGSLVGEMLTEINPFVNGTEDIAIRTEDSEIILVASEKQKGYIKTLIEKIQKITQNNLRKKYGNAPILPMLGVAVYPTDSHDMVELEKMARHEIRQMA